MNTEPTAPLDPPAPEASTLALPEPDTLSYPRDTAVEVPPRAAGTLSAPRVRWAGIVWGAAFALLAATAIWVLAEASRLDAIQEWLRDLTPGEVHPGWVIGFVALAGGLLLFLLGGLALLRNAQLRGTIER